MIPRRSGAGVRVARLLALALLLPRAAPAQPGGWDAMAAPAGAFALADLPVDGDRSQLMLRLVRLLHSVPGTEMQRLGISTLLRDLDVLQERGARAPEGAIALTLATERSGRDVLRDILEAAGLHLRERNGAFVVEVSASQRDTQLRDRLALSGVDAERVAVALNAGETVTIQPRVVELPLPLSVKVWSDAVFERPVAPRAIFSTILQDRQASLLYHGLCALTPSTREFLRQNPGLLRWLYRSGAAPWPPSAAACASKAPPSASPGALRPSTSGKRSRVSGCRTRRHSRVECSAARTADSHIYTGRSISSIRRDSGSRSVSP